MTAQPFRDRRILVVEDEWFLAVDLERELARAGAFVLGPVASVDNALALIGAEPDIDGAVVDINLRGEMAYPVADALASGGTPFVITTGYLDGSLDARYPTVIRCVKPLDFKRLEEAMASIL